MLPNSLKELLADSSIFMTGSTGFVGSSLLHRILSTGSGPKEVFILIRKKYGVDPQKRLEELKAMPLFSDMPDERLARIRVMFGDITEKNLNLSQDDLELLIARCTYVFHAAAYTAFSGRFEISVKINVLGTKYVLELAKRMNKCLALIHVSTTYANCTVRGPRFLREEIYPTEIDPLLFIHTFENMSSEERESWKTELLENYGNNMYIFTKQLAENLVANEKQHVPVAIVRPSIILNTWKTPIPGWIIGANHTMILLLSGLSHGLVTIIPGCSNSVVDLIPVDIVISAILAATLVTIREPSRLHIFHCASGEMNPITSDQFARYGSRSSRKYPTTNTYWYPHAKAKRGLRNIIALYLFCILPARVVDLVHRAFGSKQKHRLLLVQEKNMRVNISSSLCTTNNWRFCTRKMRTLLDVISLDEREQHPIDCAPIDWEDYLDKCVLGIRQYYHKESASTMDAARRRVQWFSIAYHLLPFLSFPVVRCMLVLAGCSSFVGSLLSALIIIFLMWV